MDEFVLEKIEICGFRGFTEKQEVKLGYPLTLVTGGNRRGKSSLLNAAEWCLFGPQVAAIKYGDIRERDRWEVKNLRSPECYVECGFASLPSGKKIAARRSQKAGKRTTEFWFEQSGEPRNPDDSALHALLKISPADFARAVHLHQEVLRSLITAPPAERKSAIDRLLGLSESRDVVKSVQDQKPREWASALDQSLDALSTRLLVSLKDKKTSMERDVTELSGLNLRGPDFSPDGAIRFGKALLRDMEGFAERYKLARPDLPVPEDLTGLEDLNRRLPREVSKLRSQHPLLQNQGELLTSKSRLEGLKQNFEGQLQALREAEKKIADLPEGQRNLDTIEARMAEETAQISQLDAQMQEVSRNAAVLDKALTYFRDRPAEEQLTCPVCGETTKTAADWQNHIQSEIQKRHLEPLQRRKSERETVLKSWREAKETLLGLQKGLGIEKSKLANVEAEIEKKLGIVLSETDNPAATLALRVGEITEFLKGLESEVTQINTELSAFDDSIRALDRLARIARTQRQIEQIEAISETQAFKDLRRIRQQCEQYVEDVELLTEGLRQVTGAEAERRLAGAQTAISDTFTQLTNRPDFPGLRIDTAGEEYTVKLTGPSAPQEALPILNQGDLNCAALSIFLALATAPEKAHLLRFVILDDPSQSLDSESVRNLCRVLAAVCETHQVIVATTDDELRDETLKIPKNKRHILFRAWDPLRGPDIAAELA